MTLLGPADSNELVFDEAFGKYYGGIEDPATLARLGG